MRLRALAAFALSLSACVGVTRADDDTAGTPSDAPLVSILTFQPGEDYWQRFGHNAILLRDPVSGRAVTYNYGIFDFNQKNFFLNFARGKMRYRVMPNWLENDLRLYESEHRWVREQRLDMTPAQRRELLNFLETNVEPQNAEYDYDYFVSNCSTRVRDAIDQALGGAIKAQLTGKPANTTYRFEATRLIAPIPPLAMAMDLALGPTADRPIDRQQQAFVPMELMRALRGVQVKGEDGSLHPLVASETELRAGLLPEAPAAPLDARLSFALAGVAFAAVLLVLARLRGASAAARVAFGLLAGSFVLVAGIGGVLLAILWGLTDHWAGWRNENLLLLDPLALLLVPGAFGAMRRHWQPGANFRRIVGVIVAGAILAPLVAAIPATYQANLPWVLLIAPAWLALGFVVWRPAFATPARG